MLIVFIVFNLFFLLVLSYLSVFLVFPIKCELYSKRYPVCQIFTFCDSEMDGRSLRTYR